jgi:hypothetical protein
MKQMGPLMREHRLIECMVRVLSQPVAARHGAEVILFTADPVPPTRVEDTLKSAAVLVGAANESGIPNDRSSSIQWENGLTQSGPSAIMEAIYSERELKP